MAEARKGPGISCNFQEKLGVLAGLWEDTSSLQRVWRVWDGSLSILATSCELVPPLHLQLSVLDPLLRPGPPLPCLAYFVLSLALSNCLSPLLCVPASLGASDLLGLEKEEEWPPARW